MDDDAWDNICTNPHEAQLIEGRKQGYEAGLKKGYDDGFDLGSLQGVALGVEIGFLRASCRKLQRLHDNGAPASAARTSTPTAEETRIPQSNNSSLSSIQKIQTDLLSMLDAFPGPDELFHSEENMDVQHELQRIRAKFKLLTTLLHVPHYSLKSVVSSQQATSTRTSDLRTGTAVTTRSAIEDSTEW